ncbi:phage major capsid protein [Bifidobacterium simiiventris]|uniref:phage major capsid protein n=1 Tax=Bifidobacterium simiiventris TaxID=2834434 RepID=UPI001C561054|nr:phage major capsid protein [Bifidobacterium simiiventris]MBW3077695.1 phage major capsid protein [Bifidobacterium simiiventris]
MNEIEKRRAALQTELKGLLPKVQAGDETAIKRVTEIKEKDMPALEQDAAQAKNVMDMLKAFGGSEPGASPADPQGGIRDPQAKSLGDLAAKSLDAHGYAKGMGRLDIVTPEFKANTDVVTTPASLAPALTTVDTNIVLAKRRQLVIADLFGTETISGTSLTYFVEGPVEGDYQTVAENEQKPQIHFGDPTPVTEALTKIAAYYKESDEILEDLPWLTSSIDNRALYMLGLFEENQLLNGDGTGKNLKGLLNRDGIQTETVADGETSAFDALFRAATKVQDQTPFAADGVVINPADYQTLRLNKDANGQYIAGGPFTGQYGQGGILNNPPLWGLRTVVTSAVPAGTAIVGAFSQGASLIRKGGVRVELTNANEDDFTNNRITVRVEERLALAVRYPAAFVKVSTVKTATPGA